MEIRTYTNFNKTIQQNNKIFPKQFVFFLTAQSKGGKTTVIANCLRNRKLSGWDFEPNNIYLFSKTGFIDDNFLYLRKRMSKIDDNIEMENIKTRLNDNILRKIFSDRYEEWLMYKEGIIEEPKPLLIIIDDFLGNPLLRNPNGSLCIGIPVCRHLNISFVISSQTYKSVSPIIRKNISHLMVGQVNNLSEIHQIVEEQSYVLPHRWLFKIYLDITKNNDYNFLFIDATKPLDERFRKSFKDYIKIPQEYIIN